MILHCSFEEIQALRAGARAVLDERPGNRCAVGAPRSGRRAVEALLPHLDGDLAFHTLAELRGVAGAVGAIVDCLRVEMDAFVVATHPAHEGAVAAYFDFAHALSVLGRLREMGAEMEALIEVVTGGPPDDVTSREFVFPD